MPLTPILGDLKVELQDFSPVERDEFLQGLGLEELGRPQLVRESQRLRGLVTFDTSVGPEVRAWQVPSGTPAPRTPERRGDGIPKDGTTWCRTVTCRGFATNRNSPST